MSQEVTPQFAIDYLLDDCEDCPENKDGECVTEFHCFEVKQMCIKALRGELKGEARIDELERIRKKFLWQLSNKSLQRSYQIVLEELDKYTQDRIKELKENK